VAEQQQQKQKRLHRSRSDVKLAGVLGGWSEYLGIDPSLVRIAYVIGAIFTGVVPGVLLYVLMAIIVPTEPQGAV
jgi:phage shock protein C